MTRGKKVCKILKEIRQQIADKNEIAYVTSECHFQGECKGTCPKCEAEVKYLENELHKRKLLGKAATIAGISLGIVGSFAACNISQASTPISEQKLVKQDTIGIPISTNFEEEIDNEKFFVGGIGLLPEYPGGDKACRDFLQKNLVYPKEAKEKGIQGKVYVSFTVEKDGSITQVEVVRGIEDLNEEAIRVIKMMPKWKPGTEFGKIVPIRFTMPIRFSLGDKKDTPKNKTP
jgi:TonB family protein